MKQLINSLYFLAAASCLVILASGVRFYLEGQQQPSNSFSISISVGLLIAALISEFVVICTTSISIVGTANAHFRADSNLTNGGRWPIRRVLLNLSFWSLAASVIFIPFVAMTGGRIGVAVAALLIAMTAGISATGCLFLVFHLHSDYPPGGWKKHLLMGSLSVHTVLTLLLSYGYFSWLALLEDVLSEALPLLRAGVQVGLLVTSLAAICYVRSLIQSGKPIT